MSLKNDVLNILTERKDSVSGQEIATRLGVSRTAVWKAVNALKKDGYEVESVTNRGYAIKNEGDILSKEAIEHAVKIPVVLLEEVDSTNEYAKQYSMKGKSPVLIVAKRQTNGKARHDEKFRSDGNGIYMSLLSFHPIPLTRVSEVTRFAVETIREVCGGEIRENKIFKNETQFAGVLTETMCNLDETECMIIGMGINESEQKLDRIRRIVTRLNEKLDTTK